MDRRKSFRKLKRLELVEMIYQLRKDNLEQASRIEELERQLNHTEGLLKKYTVNNNEEYLRRIEGMLRHLCGMNAETPDAGNE